jgi:hypothetical protein
MPSIFFSELHIYFLCHDSSVCRAMSYGLDDWDSIPSRDKIFLFSIASRPALEPTQPPIQWVQGGSFPGGKVAGHKADQSLPSSAKVKNS